MTLVAFDFDGTLSDSEMTVLLGAQRGVADEMAAITERAMNDEIGYAESLRERVGLLDGLSADAVESAFEHVELRPGTGDVIRALNDAGVVTAIITGGFGRGVESALARNDLPVDTIVANQLVFDDEGDLTGEVEGPLIEGTKDDALRAVANNAGLTLEDTIAVGDGANDLPMLEVAGFAVGYEPKPAVEPHCDEIVTSMDTLQTLLEEQGVL
ncbi:phosphoserine phosphatase SerB [Halococcus saccharolyticus]|uniref:phosphoserine phosphatase n=1 Tax=Halococcus saccharolyticus DSM 5350 TaxID=1227455 RepID=M0MBI2_9EURY|nr:phosphoserine phosphatase SerB [Halococcus saccharolyticus]EMA42708.1 phosphoserine phosphatase SerB [Halococcus saccharolyticus DSM 5350]